MTEKPKKKRILLRLLLILFILIFVVIAVPIAVLYVQYNNISYTPMTPVERPLEYVLPEYPEIIPGSEGITDIPDEPPATSEFIEETSSDNDTTEASAPETLPFITYTPPEGDSSLAGASASPKQNNSTASKAPKPNTKNSFSNSSKVVNVYGKIPIYKVEEKNADIINILVLGTDSRDVTMERGRSDAMIVLSYNQKTGSVKMVSLLRDLLVPIEGHDWNRINTAYAFGGVGLAVNTVNQLFGLDIQHFVVIDFNGAKDFINYIGGVELILSKSEAKQAGVEYSTEPIQLDGTAALRHMRNRSSDNDFGRTERQREVITAVFRKIISEKSLAEILDITKYAMGMVKTNISASTLTSLAASVIGNVGDLAIESQSIPYKDAYQFAWYKKMAILSFNIEDTASRLQDFLY